MTSVSAAKNKRTLPSFFIKDSEVSSFLKEDLDNLTNSCLDGFLFSKKSLRKDLLCIADELTQKVVDHHALFAQWIDSSDEAAALHRAYSDMVLLGISLEEAAKNAQADPDDLRWLVERRPPDKVDKQKVKPVPIKKGSKR